MVYATTDAAALAVVPPQKAGAASGIALTGLVLAGSFGVTATATAELIEAFGGEPIVTLQSISSTTLVGAAIAAATILLALALLPGRGPAHRVRRE
jgi:predicted MFS family arabinose efflux permease